MIKFIGIALLCITAACAAPPRRATPEAEPRTRTVAVLEFEEHRIDSEGAVRGIGRSSADRVTERLAGRPDLTLIDRESLQNVLKELALSSGDLVRSDERLHLGRLLGAHYLIAGGVTAVGKEFRIDGRIIDVEKGLADGTSVQGTLSQRKTLEETFSRQVADQLSLKIGETGSEPKRGEDFFNQGLKLEMGNHPAEALKMYQKALSLDPRHHEARERMEQLLLKEIE